MKEKKSGDETASKLSHAEGKLADMTIFNDLAV
jgi:hypothetical protein